MATELLWKVDKHALDSPHVKANLLLQSHFARAALPMSDYVTDTKSVLDQALRVLQAMVDVAADGGWMFTALGAMHLTQMVSQGRFVGPDAGSELADLPHVGAGVEAALGKHGVRSLRDLLRARPDDLRRWLGGSRQRGSRQQPLLGEAQLGELTGLLRTLPLMSMRTEPPKAALAPGQETSVTVHVEALNPASRRNAYAPRFPKAKKAGWWLMMGEEDELFALKRITLDRGHLTAELQFAAAEEPGEHVYAVRLVSDSYIGLDLEGEVRVHVA